MTEPVLSVITRAHNRLEYTVQCLASAKHNLGVPFEHIVVNQGSRDGTREWLRHVTSEVEWYKHVRVIELDVNAGDMGGMRVGAEHARADVIMQLDNDAILMQPESAAPMLRLLELKQCMAVMLYRHGVQQRLRPRQERYERVHLIDDPELGDEQRRLCGLVCIPVMCYVIGRQRFLDLGLVPNCWQGYPKWETWKIFDMAALHIEGYNPYFCAGENQYINRHKYPKDSIASGLVRGPLPAKQETIVNG